MSASLQALAPVSALEERLGTTFEGTDLIRAQRALEDASELVRTETGLKWIDTEGQPCAPDAVVVVVLQMAKRAYLNPEGLTSESVEGYSWQGDQQNVGIYMSDEELRAVQAAAREWRLAHLPPGQRWSGTGSITIRPATRPRLPWEWWF